ncbi:unnamed protein product [Anisakis simplex]|uniref:Uncharacterized protein n=1 Tax=Anisakis simplex TaxID=6269 RepID=A0A3P6TPH0_ANISI|nr:unnamed protein product [Anisakis simplex]
MPFYEVIHKDATKWLQQIKIGLATSTSLYALDSGLVFWMNQLRE